MTTRFKRQFRQHLEAEGVEVLDMHQSRKRLHWRVAWPDGQVATIVTGITPGQSSFVDATRTLRRKRAGFYA